MTNRPLEFLNFAYQANALQFGEFALKSGRVSPYFLNTGTFANGKELTKLARYYASIIQDKICGKFMLFGPSYKGIPLATATALCLYQRFDRSVEYAFDRKETKDHGEGGQTVGASLSGRVVIIDDVITSGLAIDKSVALIRAHGAEPTAVVICLDRKERATNSKYSSVENVKQRHNIEVWAVATVVDVLEFVNQDHNLAPQTKAIQKYLDLYLPAIS